VRRAARDRLAAPGHCGTVPRCATLPAGGDRRRAASRAAGILWRLLAVARGVGIRDCSSVAARAEPPPRRGTGCAQQQRLGRRVMCGPEWTATTQCRRVTSLRSGTATPGTTRRVGFRVQAIRAPWADARAAGPAPWMRTARSRRTAPATSADAVGRTTGTCLPGGTVPAGRRLWVRVARQGGALPGLPGRRYRSGALPAGSDVAVISWVLDMTVEAL